MTTEEKVLTDEQATAAITAKVEIAQAAIKEAERIAAEAGVRFSFEIGDGYGTYYTHKDRNGKPTGYWDGWQGSSC
jgi:hypothetical protein